MFKCGKRGYFARTCRTWYPTSSMFQLQRTDSHSPELLKETGKWRKGTPTCWECVPLVWTKCLHYRICTIHNTHSVYAKCCPLHQGKIGNHSVLLLGVSCSVMRKDYASGNLIQPIEGTKLVRTTFPCGTIVIAVILRKLQVVPTIYPIAIYTLDARYIP